MSMRGTQWAQTRVLEAVIGRPIRLNPRVSGDPAVLSHDLRKASQRLRLRASPNACPLVHPTRVSSRRGFVSFQSCQIKVSPESLDAAEVVLKEDGSSSIEPEENENDSVDPEEDDQDGMGLEENGRLTENPKESDYYTIERAKEELRLSLAKFSENYRP